MVRPSVIVALVLLVLLQATLTPGWWVRRRRRRTPRTCSFPRATYSGSHSDYFYGSTSLFSGKKFGGKRSRIVQNQLSLKHSLLMFRGKIFEWGLGSPKTYKMNRNRNDCTIKWTYARKGWSKCLLSEVVTWTKQYQQREGRYRLFTNNCHFFVNRLGRYLMTDCGR